MAFRRTSPALIAHGGAGARGAAADRAERRHALLAAVRRGADLLREGGSALDAVQVTVVELEDDPRFNAGTGSVLTSLGTVEMDASVMVMERGHGGEARISAGAVAAVSRVKNPLMLARAVMEETPHVMLAGSGAHRFARRAGIQLCRGEDLITARARERWSARQLQLRNRS
jgi:L-asparaginase / beta-aspartyl-peptidase